MFNVLIMYSLLGGGGGQKGEEEEKSMRVIILVEKWEVRLANGICV